MDFQTRTNYMLSQCYVRRALVLKTTKLSLSDNICFNVTLVLSKPYIEGTNKFIKEINERQKTHIITTYLQHI